MNAADPKIRLPEGKNVKPSQWLRQLPQTYIRQNWNQVLSPDGGDYPNLKTQLMTYSGLFFSPNTNKPDDIASGPFWYAANAMATFQNSLLPPPNRSPKTSRRLKAVLCSVVLKFLSRLIVQLRHIPPFFTDNI